MITVAEKTVKLQIWDTVNTNKFRLASSPLNQSQGDTTDLQPEPS